MFNNYIDVEIYGNITVFNFFKMYWYQYIHVMTYISSIVIEL